jgi:purine-nucleoside phosphorylase
MTGPNYETRAEYRFLRQFGDLVGMSTVPEVIAARSMGIRAVGLSVVSNACNPDQLEPTDGAQVVAAVARAAGRVGETLARLLPQL